MFSSMLRIIFILSIMVVWVLYYSITQQKHQSAVLSYVEVLPYDSRQVSRKMSKQNLHIIREANARRKIENMLFDKFWYQSRNDKSLKGRMDRLLVAREKEMTKLQRLETSEKKFSQKDSKESKDLKDALSPGVKKFRSALRKWFQKHYGDMILEVEQETYKRIVKEEEQFDKNEQRNYRLSKFDQEDFFDE